jgi:hypothetical protein
LYSSEGGGFLPEETKADVIWLEGVGKILAENEAAWKLKSRAVWLEKGDEISNPFPWMILGAKFRSWANFPWFFQKRDSLF